MTRSELFGEKNFALGTGCHPGSETSVGLPGQQKLYVRRSHMRPEPLHDELHTFRRETEPRRHCRNEGWIRAVAESHCRHDMMNVVVGNNEVSCEWIATPW